MSVDVADAHDAARVVVIVVIDESSRRIVQELVNIELVELVRHRPLAVVVVHGELEVERVELDMLDVHHVIGDVGAAIGHESASAIVPSLGEHVRLESRRHQTFYH